MENCKKLSYSILFLVLFLICWAILKDANWLYSGALYPGEDWQFLTTTAIGRVAHGQPWGGRFFPLGMSDYSILLLIPYGYTPCAHFIYTCIIMVFASLILFSFINKLTGNSYILALFSLLILFSSAAFIRIHMECIYSERMIFFLLSVFMVCYVKAKESQDFKYYFLSFLMAALATYMKEPIFGMFTIVAVVELLFDKLSKKDKNFNYALLLNSFIFLAIYIFRRLKKPVYIPYASFSTDISFELFTQEPLLYLIVFLALIRSYHFFINEDRSNVFIDALLFAGVGYAFAYFLLKLSISYFLFPSVVLFMPAFAIFIKKCNLHIKALAIMSAVLCVIPNFAANKYLIENGWYHRKNDHFFFEYIIDQYRSGKKIYWLSDALLRKRPDEADRHFDRIFVAFLRYYNGGEILLRRDSDIEKMGKDCVVIYGPRTTSSSSFYRTEKELEKKGLHRSKELIGNVVFSSD